MPHRANQPPDASVLGISFHTAPVALREQASIGPAETPAALARLRHLYPHSEFVLLSTCNRTELYAAGLDMAAARRDLIGLLLKADATLRPHDLDTHFTIKTGPAAAEHLLAVAASLDAMVVGETEILGQVKRAFAAAEIAGTAGPLLQPLFHAAFRIARRVHTETGIGRGRVSVSSLAVEFAEKAFDDLAARTVMLVGAGETAELALKSLTERGVRNILVLNRSPERGLALARRCGGRSVSFDGLEDHLAHADIVISSTGATHPVIRADAVRQAIGTRDGRPMLLLDIAVPRDIDPDAARIPDVTLLSIDDLRSIAFRNLERRRLEVDRARAIVRQGAADYTAAHAARPTKTR